MNAPLQSAPPTAVDLSRSPYAKLFQVSPLSVELKDGFLAHCWERNFNISLHAQAERLEEYGNFDNFRRIADPDIAPFRGKVFNDSDVYKWIEGVSWALARRFDARLAKKLDEAIALIESVQRPDGYINTYYAVEREHVRWTNLRDNHELYCAGHLIQAAVAHHRALRDKRLITVAARFADLICDVFGPESEKKNPDIDGHEEIELALVELYRETRNRRYLDQAEYFVNARGYQRLQGGWFGIEYFQDHVPLREQKDITGHAVRALYFNTGAADLYLENGEKKLFVALQRLWNSMVGRRMYISGGVGSRHHGEAFGADYELPNAQAYTETCAAIASMMWNQRMLAATGDARYADLFEHTLYNGMLPGWSMDGAQYFYVNPLANNGSHRRLDWYECACCPPNIGRTISAISGAVYSTAQNAIYIQMYTNSSAEISFNGKTVGIVQRTRYPWDGEVDISINASDEFDLMVRIPSWCVSGASLTVNNEAVSSDLVPGSFVRLSRAWSPGDLVRLRLPMAPRVMQSHPHVLENVGRVALTRGPLLYCIEAVDHPGAPLSDVQIASDSVVNAEWEADLLGGLVVLRTIGEVELPDERWTEALYLEQLPASRKSTRSVALTAVPYFAWNNRAAGPMQVWIKYRDKEVTYG